MKTTRKPEANKDSTSIFKKISEALKHRRTEFLTRRPHRSFRLTNRRDYVRSLQLPGYIAFTREVSRFTYKHWRLFLGLTVVSAGLNAIFVGLSSQSTYAQLSDILDESSSNLFTGGWGEVGKAGLLVVSSLGGSFAPQLSDVQQVYALIFFLIIWLATLWLVRVLLQEKLKPSLRDALYNSSAPLVSTSIVLFIFLLQLFPAAIAVIALNAAVSAGVIAAGGPIAMILSIVIALLIVLSLYWGVSTLLALVVVSLPGMYPLHAIRTAGDLVIGRRIRILLRVLWMSLLVSVSWVIIVLPTIIIDRMIKNVLPSLEWLPIIPLSILLLTSFATVWSAIYIYMLYRKVVDDDAEPA